MDDLPNASDVSLEHQNTIILTHIIKFPKFSTSRFDSTYITLKIFPSDVLAPESKKEIETQLKHVYYHCPLALYDPIPPDQTFINSLHLDSNWFENLTLQQCIFARFSEIPSVGCPHYCSGCELQCVTCLKFYGCRYCHDEVEDHTLPKFEIDTVRCRYCAKTQKFGLQCQFCNQKFGKISCEICKFLCFIDHNAKPFFHCTDCGRCQCGDKAEYQHCKTCKLCIRKNEFAVHICAKECSACLGCIGDSFMAYIVPKCGHFIHTSCKNEMLNQMNYSCPICRKSILGEDIKRYMSSFIMFLYGQKLMQKTRRICIFQCNDCGIKFEDFDYQLNNCEQCDTYNCAVLGDGENMLKLNNDDFQKYFVKYVSGMLDKSKYLTLEQLCTDQELDLQKITKLLEFPEFRSAIPSFKKFKKLLKFVNDQI